LAVLRGNNTSSSLRQSKSVLNVNDLTDVVQDLETVNELAPLLWVVKPGKHTGRELVFDTEFSLEVDIEKFRKIF
jgi:hypothetical protein